jgi:regulator of sirC expression with transglutaminase-like and TPR domain
VLSDQLRQSFTRAAHSPDPDLAVAALMIARVEYPNLDAAPYLEQLDALGREAAARVAAAGAAEDVPTGVDPDAYARISALNEFLFKEQRFVGNDRHYEDPRNSCLNQVLDRRTGIPITLALVYMEVARRAGVIVEGVNSPGHFLVRCPAGPTSAPRSLRYRDLIIDAHHGGALLSEDACRQLLRRHAGDSGWWARGAISQDAGDVERAEAVDRALLSHATKPQILTRMLVNLKRVYVRMFSFPQARDVTELLLALDPSAMSELRDRGLLAYHLNDFPSALRDLQAYLMLSATGEPDEDERDEQAQIWEHVKTLRRRVASLN